MTVKFVDELSIEQEAKERWRQDPALRVEFGEFSTYLAFMKAEARGAVKIVRTLEMKARIVLGGSAQRPIHREDRQELSKWVRQALQTIRKDSTSAGTKSHNVRTLEGPRRLSDTELLELVTSEQDAQDYWKMSAALREEFPTPGSLWHFAKAKRERRVKFLSR